MIPEQIIERTLHDNVCDFGNLFHGWMCVVGNKIWKNDNGVFLFEDRTAANQAFYNSMRWKLRSIVKLRSLFILFIVILQTCIVAYLLHRLAYYNCLHHFDLVLPVYSKCFGFYTWHLLGLASCYVASLYPPAFVAYGDFQDFCLSPLFRMRCRPSSRQA